MKNNWLMLALLAASLAGCTSTDMETKEDNEPGTQVKQQVRQVTGNVIYRERMALPDIAVLEVQLQDVSLADAPATVISSATISPTGQVPIPFSLDYRPETIDPANRYALSARIEVEGRLMFINDTHTPVLTHGGGERSDIMLIRVQPSETADGPGEQLTGMFTYMADAAMFMDCRSGRRFPVAMEGAYIDLERAYTQSQDEPGQALQVAVRGRYLGRPRMEGDGERVHLIVDRFDGFLPDECTPKPLATLRNTYWKLTHINGAAVVVSEDGREAHMVLGLDTPGVRGNGGCNQFFGSFKLAQDSLSFSGIGFTMMLCAEGSETEQAFFAALDATTGYRIEGEVLQLLAGEDILARFEAVYF